ncbi:hypothetical protein ACIHFC_36780 [Streptomyces sp. NPDC052013]|uniref:hypothetical protein n=1 Tax=Streptomyces sp. NPDC052013 TaxID=3365679 RepID=UPI0037D0AF60
MRFEAHVLAVRCPQGFAPAARGIRRGASDPEQAERWLLADWPADASDPVQYWLSSVPKDALATLIWLVKLCWLIEHVYR